VQFTVRDYRPEDFDTLWLIDQSCFAPGIAYTRYELRTYMLRPRAFTLVAQSENSAPGSKGFILGFVVAESSRRGTGHVVTIDVRTAARRLRVGSALLHAAESRLRAENCSSVHLETAADNLSAQSFYKRHGYDVAGRIRHYYSNGVDALVLEKKLISAKTAS
jgi:ribosomal-protein-alanine N-acetyltransferase